MADQLNKVVKKIVQRTSTNTGKLRTVDERTAFSNNVRADLASIFDQLNTVYYPLVNVLMSEQTLNALDYGLSGNVIKTHITADAASADAYWDAALARGRTIKETIDVLLSEIARLENLITELSDASKFDDTEIWAELDEQNLDLAQLAKDTMGPNYTLDGDGNANLTYSVAQALDALGAFFTGWPGTGNTYTSTFPSLTLQVLLSSIVIDTTLPESTITDLTTHLAAIRTFVGMDTATDSTPDYSAHGAVTVVSDGMSLEEAIQALDANLGTPLPVYTTGAILFGNGTNIPITDAPGFFYNTATKRMGIGTNTPEQTLDVRGVIQHLSGVISRGGNARGANATDLQTVRGVATQVASGARSSILGGQNNTASGQDSVAGGVGSGATNTGAVALGNNAQAGGPQAFATGFNTQAGGQSASVFGDNCQAGGAWSQASGQRAAATLQGERALANGQFANTGDAQSSEVVVRQQTNVIGPTEMFLDGAGARIILQDNSSYSIVVNVIARDQQPLTNHYILEGTIERNAGPGTTNLVGAVTKRIIAEEFVAGDANLIADNVNGAAVVQVTGVAGTNIRWVAHVRLTKVTF
jgi:hypothetical protein